MDRNIFVHEPRLNTIGMVIRVFRPITKRRKRMRLFNICWNMRLTLLVRYGWGRSFFFSLTPAMIYGVIFHFFVVGAPGETTINSVRHEKTFPVLIVLYGCPGWPCRLRSGPVPPKGPAPFERSRRYAAYSRSLLAPNRQFFLSEVHRDRVVHLDCFDIWSETRQKCSIHSERTMNVNPKGCGLGKLHLSILQVISYKILH